jgi:hypothetical protein
LERVPMKQNQAGKLCSRLMEYAMASMAALSTCDGSSCHTG